MMVNLSNIRNNKNDAISEYFNRDDHVFDDYQVVAIEKTYGDEISRLTKESFWIKKLKTLQPEGLNTQIDLI